jgi:hypothetical protein
MAGTNMTVDTWRDFRYRKDMHYDNLPTGTGNGEFPFYLRKKARPEPKHGKVCPACGLTRSLTGVCDCNA